MQYGSFIAEITTASQALPLSGVNVLICSNDYQFVDNLQTDDTGKTAEIWLMAPDRSLSLDETYTGLPYSTYNIEISFEGYAMVNINGIQIFAGEQALQQIELFPSARSNISEDSIIIPEHSLIKNDGTNSGNAPDEGFGTFVLAFPIIPEFITVHLGRPTASAANVTISFKDYIKNVASSEIYPTWPEECLRANIYCQISLALNRVYTEWYLSKGYNYQITNSTAFDQAYVNGRDIFTNISKLVDEIFNEYIRKFDYIEPFYAEYCDGKQAQCPGLKQWGSKDLALKGYNNFQILQYYYGDKIEIIESDRIQGVSGSFPGFNLRLGVKNDAVAMIQNQLNRISVNYPNIPPIYPVDGIFGATTEKSVKVFQKQFNLTSDGIIGKGTWYKISYIFVAVKKLAELTSEGNQQKPSGVFPGILRQGSKGVAVQELQFYLLKLSDFTPHVSPVKVDSNFGRGTYASVIEFQRLARITPDGIVGKQTWDILYKAYLDTLSVASPIIPPVPPYPGTPLKIGSRGENVRALQYYLNTINFSYGSAMIINVDGIFGNATDKAVREFQRINNLSVDGIVGKATWDKVVESFNSVATSPIAASGVNYQLFDYTYHNYTNLLYRI
ncbi:MAG: peptidoglycan-binding protein [Erysipelotrichaceae bacterium]